MNEDTTYRHLIRTNQEDFIKDWEKVGVYLPMSYAKDFLAFNKFCIDNNWTFNEGLVLLSSSYFEKEIKKSIEALDKINEYKRIGIEE